MVKLNDSMSSPRSTARPGDEGGPGKKTYLTCQEIQEGDSCYGLIFSDLIWGKEKHP
jgi:hypothetical protein